MAPAPSWSAAQRGGCLHALAMISGHAVSRVYIIDIMRPAVAPKHALTYALQQSQDSHRWLEEGATAYAGSALTLHYLVLIV